MIRKELIWIYMAGGYGIHNQKLANVPIDKQCYKLIHEVSQQSSGSVQLTNSIMCNELSHTNPLGSTRAAMNRPCTCDRYIVSDVFILYQFTLERSHSLSDKALCMNNESEHHLRLNHLILHVIQVLFSSFFPTGNKYPLVTRFTCKDVCQKEAEMKQFLMKSTKQASHITHCHSS